MEKKEDIKKLKGLKTPNKYIIKSLSDYINKLSMFKDNKYYFRGESKYYNDILSSGLRIDDIDYRKKPEFQRMIKKYYIEVGQRISEIDRRAFTAFSQHHGIPTNLIDISTSPLISLYFACENDLDDNGFVYLINRRNTIEITERIHHINQIYINIFDIIASDKKEDIIKNFEMFCELFIDNKELFIYLFGILIDEYTYYDNFISLEKKRISFLKKASKGFEEKQISMFFDHTKDDEKDRIKNEINKIQKRYEEKLDDFIEKETNYEVELRIESYEEKLIYIYYFMSKGFIDFIKEYGEFIPWVNFLPIFTYNPVTDFQRIKNQEGLFIHQGYQVGHDKVYDMSVFARQRIWPDKVFVIENKRKILQELDMLGFNEKYIFFDFDSIAKYIKNN
ncbi:MULTISPECIES: FRG domain-containing protein [Clostridium]|uniref:FRG domain-containing protein n=1 Tax=Clostridium TaxID=1485 RepID=UPI0029049EA8|nr:MULTISPECIES: FRG domain-containing protein [Clostridium]MDU1229893.1 FRG domain-containing protein [Clostridium sp.]